MGLKRASSLKINWTWPTGSPAGRQTMGKAWPPCSYPRTQPALPIPIWIIRPMLGAKQAEAMRLAGSAFCASSGSDLHKAHTQALPLPLPVTPPKCLWVRQTIFLVNKAVWKACAKHFAKEERGKVTLTCQGTISHLNGYIYQESGVRLGRCDILLEIPRKKWPLGLRWLSMVCSYLCPKGQVPGEAFRVK